ncbi:glycosyltransferase family 2 protein [Tabrizicola sp. M-4]|uniref:glycosyltransferase family 2 protein n=1 Tax=Tabrizicola sp. M-4 TaxID=3055847 RepID=UPI003DA951FF
MAIRSPDAAQPSPLPESGLPFPDQAPAPPPGLAEAPLPFRLPLALPAFRAAQRPLPAPAAEAAPPRQLDLPLPADPLTDPPDPDLLRRFGAARALRENLLPWRRRNGAVLVLTASPQDFDRRADFLASLFGPDVRPLPCPRPLLQATLLAHAGEDLAAAAARRVPAIASCRSFDRATLTLLCGIPALGLLSLAILSPRMMALSLIALSIFTLIAQTLLKSATALAALRAPPPAPPELDDTDLPVISLLIALYSEEDIAPRLIRRLSALDYPLDRLETLILVEEDDAPTRAALAASALPPWMRVLAVPAGKIRTKPRALNFGLDFTRGSIIGIYDAEDAPAPDQLRKVAATFAAAPPQVACLQGVLDFYNPRTNWIARCFTMEYAVWFRLILPGLDRLGLPIPLGGTTVFLRRHALCAVGAWDAHNVTEDADLGFRLARQGWETRILRSTTLEEANCRPIAWIKQRSRWTKGYLMTWLVHMRAPRALWRDLGARRFIAMQTLVLGALLQALLAPLYLSFLVFPPLAGHPLADALPAGASLAVIAFFFCAQAFNFALSALALRLAGHPPQWPWLLATPVYFCLATLAGLKALAEAILRPFHWDKTRHGRHDGDSGS